MVNIEVDKVNRILVLKTDDPSVKFLLEREDVVTEFVPFLKRMSKVTRVTKIYNNKRLIPSGGIWTYYINYGWAAYLVNVFKPYITQGEFETILKETIYADTYRTLPFSELRDYQNDDVLHILKYRVGLFSVFTSYGKTQTIAVLANYFHSIGQKVMIVAPGKKPKDELVKRCKTLYGIDIPSDDLSINCIITSGLMNRKDVNTPTELEKLEQLWATYDVILVDEVEYTMNDSGKFLFDRFKGASRMYAFSGTADKARGEMISFIDGISEVVARNRDLVSYFGPSLIYRVPLTMKIDNIEILTRSLDNIVIPKDLLDGKKSVVYNKIMDKIWTDPEICKVIVKVAKKFPKLFIPINSLNSIIDNWINNYFIGTLRVLLVCGEGYIYYDLGGNKTKLTLKEACEYIEKDLVDVIPSTSAGYRALDFPGLENILLVQGKVAGVVLQSAGRVCRGNHANIIALNSTTGRKIPIYTKGLQERKELFDTYYKYCDITDSLIYEENL